MNDLLVERVYEYTLTPFNPSKEQLFIFQIKYKLYDIKKEEYAYNLSSILNILL